VSTLINVWYAPSDSIGHLICAATNSPVCHVGAAVADDQGATTYINVGSPNLTLLSFIPGGYYAMKTWNITADQAKACLDYMHDMAGKPYPDSTLLMDLFNAKFGTHLEASSDGECVCSGTVANIDVRADVLETTTPAQETPGSLYTKLGATPA